MFEICWIDITRFFGLVLHFEWNCTFHFNTVFKISGLASMCLCSDFQLTFLTLHFKKIQASKPVRGKEAFSLGLVDGLVQPNDLVNTARQWALDILGHRRPWVASLYKTDKLEPLGEAREILKFARAQARKRAPNLYHPLVCIDIIEAGIVAGPRAGLWKVVICLHQYIPFPLHITVA